MWDLSSLTRDQTHVPCIGRQILNHWTTREVPVKVIFDSRPEADAQVSREDIWQSVLQVKR